MTIQNIIDAFNRGQEKYFAETKSCYVKSNIKVYKKFDKVSYIKKSDEVLNIYTWLIDPRFNTIPTLLADKEFSKSFWKWMGKMKYGSLVKHHDLVKGVCVSTSKQPHLLLNGSWIKPTSQALQGYVVPYITNIIGEQQ